MLEAELGYGEATLELNDKLAAVERDPDAPPTDDGPDGPPTDGRPDALGRFLRYGIWRYPGLLDCLEAYGRVWEQAARRHGISFCLSDWVRDLTGGSPEWWRFHLAFHAQREREVATGTCSCCKDGRRTRCTCHDWPWTPPWYSYSRTAVEGTTR